MKKLLITTAIILGLTGMATAEENLSSDYKYWTDKGYKLINAVSDTSGGSTYIASHIQLIFLNPQAENGKQIVLCKRYMNSSGAPTGKSSCYWG